MRIAWRYAQQQQPQHTKTEPIAKTFQSNYFLMNKLMAKEDVYASSNVDTFKLDDTDTDSHENEAFNSLYAKLAKDLTLQIDSLNLNINKTKQYTNILRIGM